MVDGKFLCQPRIGITLRRRQRKTSSRMLAARSATGTPASCSFKIPMILTLPLGLDRAAPVYPRANLSAAEQVRRRGNVGYYSLAPSANSSAIRLASYWAKIISFSALSFALMRGMRTRPCRYALTRAIKTTLEALPNWFGSVGIESQS